MIWAVIYVAGAGAYCWFALSLRSREFGPRNGKPDEMEQWTAVAFTLLMSALWPFFAVVDGVMALERKERAKR